MRMDWLSPPSYLPRPVHPDVKWIDIFLSFNRSILARSAF